MIPGGLELAHVYCIMLINIVGEREPAVKTYSKMSKMVLKKLKFQSWIDVHCSTEKREPFLVSSDNKPHDISITNKSLSSLCPNLTYSSSSASTLLRQDSTLQEWRSRLAGLLQNLSRRLGDILNLNFQAEDNL